MQQQVRQSIEDFPLREGQGAWQSSLHQLVLGYLVHHGYADTALTFASSTMHSIKEDTASIRNRQSKLSLIRFLLLTLFIPTRC